jgi:oligosaccharide repeat unit polymerase
MLWIGLIFTTKNTSVFGNITVGDTILLFLVGYIVGPVLGLDYVLAHPQQYVGQPNHIFKFFLSAASSMHLIEYTPPPRLDQLAPLAFPTNMYTVYKFYYTDYGILGTLVAITVIGFIQTMLYRKARTKSVFGMYYSLSVFPLIMAFFDDHYSSFGTITDIVGFGLAYLLLARLRLILLPRREAVQPALGQTEAL